MHVYPTPSVPVDPPPVDLRRLQVPIRTIPGVILGLPLSGVLGASDRNGPGKGAIRSERDGRTLSWRAPGSAKFGDGVTVTADSDVLLEDGEDTGKFVQARIKVAHLQPRPTERAVYMQERWNGNFSDVTANEASAGTETNFPFTAINRSSFTIHGVRVWLDDVAAPYLSLSVGGAYSTPTTEETALLIPVSGGFPDGALQPTWANLGSFTVKRTIPPATAFNPKVLALLHFSFDGF